VAGICGINDPAGKRWLTSVSAKISGSLGQQNVWALTEKQQYCGRSSFTIRWHETGPVVHV
jgi:hypothetical protein